MTDTALGRAVEHAFGEATGKEGASLFSRINALSVFQSRQVPPEEWPAFSPELPREGYETAYE